MTDDLDRESQLPHSWGLPCFDEVFDVVSTNGKKIKQREYQKCGAIPVIDQGEDFIGGYTDDVDAVIRVDVPLIVFGDHTRKFKLVKHDFAPGADGIKVLSPSAALIPEFSFYACLALRLPSRGYARHFSILKKHKFPIAPLNEQRRIVEKIETLFAQLDQGEDALRYVLKLLSRYRQSILKAAVTGVLTADWRVENAHCLEHGGDDLLERILKARREKWQGRGKYQEPDAPDTRNLPDLPKGWVWVTLGSLIADGPQNGLYLPQTKYGSGTPILRIDDYQVDWIRPHADLRLVKADESECLKYSLKPNDFVVNRVNSISHLGKTTLIGEGYSGVLFESNMMRFSVSSEISKEYLLLYLTSEVGRKRLIMNCKHAVNQASINQGDIANTPVPLPTMLEQEEIAQRVIMESSRELTTSGWCQAELIRSTALRQSILKDAFVGKLVPQDPNDEPVAELLGRIRTERSANPQKRTRHRATE